MGLALVALIVAQSAQSGPATFEQTCLQYDGSRQHYCDGAALAFCAQLRATVSIDACTAEVKRQLDAKKEADRIAEATPEAIARRRAFALTPQGRLLHSTQMFYATPDIRDCVMKNQMDVRVLERCKVDPHAEYALAAVDFIAKIRPAQPRYPGMTIGGSAAWATPWVNAHCLALAVGYRCTWRGITLDYQ